MNTARQQLTEQEIGRAMQRLARVETRVETIYPRESAVAVGLYVTAGLSIEEIAALTHTHRSTVARELKYLARYLGIDDDQGGSVRTPLVSVLCQYLPQYLSVPTTEYNLGDVLSQKELEIAGYISQGMQNKEIAAKRARSVRTIKNHVSRMIAKLRPYGVESRVGIALAYTQQMTNPPSHTPVKAYYEH